MRALVLIVPVWCNQTWFPTLLTKLIDLPILLPDFIANQMGLRDTPTDRVKQPAPGRLQSCRESIQEHKMNLSESFQQHEGKALKNPTHQHEESEYFGVTEQYQSLSIIYRICFGLLTKQFHEGKQYTTLNQWRREGRAWPGTCPDKAPCLSRSPCNLARSPGEHEANGLAYSSCPANTNDLATPLR